MADVVRWIHKDGKAIPIRAAGGAAVNSGKQKAVAMAKNIAAKGSASALKPKKQSQFHTIAAQVTRKQPAIKPNKFLKYGSMAWSVAGGIGTGLALGHGFKASALAESLDLATEPVTIGMAAGAYAGKGNTRGRAKLMAKQEGVNQALGWGAYAATALGSKVGRATLLEGAEKVGSMAAKILTVGRKALRVV